MAHRGLSRESRLPTHTTGPSTHPYEQVLRNRIRFDRLESDGDLYIRRHRPIFLHDTMMLPGSLANLIGEVLSSNFIFYLHVADHFCSILGHRHRSRRPSHACKTTRLPRICPRHDRQSHAHPNETSRFCGPRCPVLRLRQACTRIHRPALPTACTAGRRGCPI